jgi:hypothetical protein
MGGYDWPRIVLIGSQYDLSLVYPPSPALWGQVFPLKFFEQSDTDAWLPWMFQSFI